MLETLNSPLTTQDGKNVAAEPISRKDTAAINLAGMIDGEGCVSAYFKKQTNPKSRHCTTLKLSITVYNTHPTFIRRVSEHLKTLEVPFTYSLGNRKGTEKHGVSVVVEGFGRTAKLLPLIIPYLSAKRRQAELLLELVEYRTSLLARFQNERGCFIGMNLNNDENVKRLIEAIRVEKHEYPCVTTFSRRPNCIFGESSET